MTIQMRVTGELMFLCCQLYSRKIFVVTCLKYLIHGVDFSHARYHIEHDHDRFTSGTGWSFSCTVVIFSSVISASFNHILITPEVTWKQTNNF